MSKRRVTVDETRKCYLDKHRLEKVLNIQPVLQPIAQPVIQPAAQAPVRRRRNLNEFEWGQDEALAAPLLPSPNKRQRNSASQPPRPVELAPPVVNRTTVNNLDHIGQGNPGIFNGDGAVPLNFGNFDNFAVFYDNGALPPVAENFDFGGAPQELDGPPELEIWANGPTGDNMDIVNFGNDDGNGALPSNAGNFDFDFDFEGVPDLSQPGDNMGIVNFGNFDGNGVLLPNAGNFDFEFDFEGVPDLPQPGDNVDFDNFVNLNDAGAQQSVAGNFDFDFGIEGMPEFPPAANDEGPTAFEAGLDVPEFDAPGFDAGSADQWLETYEYGDQQAENLHLDPAQQPQQWAEPPLPVPVAAAPELVWDGCVDLSFLAKKESTTMSDEEFTDWLESFDSSS